MINTNINVPLKPKNGEAIIKRISVTSQTEVN